MAPPGERGRGGDGGGGLDYQGNLRGNSCRFGCIASACGPRVWVAAERGEGRRGCAGAGACGV
jgi:hypothetical protein